MSNEEHVCASFESHKKTRSYEDRRAAASRLEWIARSGQIAQLREAHTQRTRIAEMAAAQSALEQARSAWPAALSAWDAWLVSGPPLWAEMGRLAATERASLVKLEQRGQPDPDGVHIPETPQGDFPIPKALAERLHWNFEQFRQERQDRVAEWRASHPDAVGGPLTASR